MEKFIISTDSCADYFKSKMQQENIYCVAIKRIHGDTVYEEFYDSSEEFDEFYDGVGKGKLSSTSQINPDEFIDYFKSILEKEKVGDIIHVSLSSGLSGTCNGAVLAANELNETLKGRRIYVVDSLHATAGIMMLVDELIELNGKVNSASAVKTIEEIRNNQQAFFMVDDLNHLKRGGRLSATKALIGTILGVKPILALNNHGKIVPVSKAKGQSKALQMLIELSSKYSDKSNPDFAGSTIYIARSSKSETYENMKKIVFEKYPQANVKEVIIGPVIGTHLGCGAVGFIFKGEPRLDIAH